MPRECKMSSKNENSVSAKSHKTNPPGQSLLAPRPRLTCTLQGVQVVKMNLYTQHMRTQQLWNKGNHPYRKLKVLHHMIVIRMQLLKITIRRSI